MNYNVLVDRLLDLAIAEDIDTGDITTDSLIPSKLDAVAIMTAKESGVVSGIEIAEKVFRRFSDNIKWTPLVNDGDYVQKGKDILKIEADFKTLLKGERISLNIMQRMSGIATAVREYVHEMEGSNTSLLDTRKTAPGMRVLDKMAVKHGGGVNHRMGLYDMVLIKDNHIKIAGSVQEAVLQIRKKVKDGIKVEVEVTNFTELNQAIESGADIIMLDNMSTDQMAEAVKIIAGRAKIEASGNMTLNRIREVAATGVDFISVGALTHSVKAMDISMNIKF